MLIRDQFGYFHEIPDARFGGWGNHGLGEVVYDGLGNPVGAFPFLAALAPLAAKILPMVSSILPGLAPASPSAPPPSPAPSEPPPPPPYRRRWHYLTRRHRQRCHLNRRWWSFASPAPRYRPSRRHRRGLARQAFIGPTPERQAPPSHTSAAKGRARHRAGQRPAASVTAASFAATGD